MKEPPMTSIISSAGRFPPAGGWTGPSPRLALGGSAPLPAPPRSAECREVRNAAEYGMPRSAECREVRNSVECGMPRPPGDRHA